MSVQVCVPTQEIFANPRPRTLEVGASSWRVRIACRILAQDWVNVGQQVKRRLDGSFLTPMKAAAFGLQVVASLL